MSGGFSCESAPSPAMEMPPDAQPPVKKNVPRSAAAVLPFFFLNHRLEPARLQARIRDVKAAVMPATVPADDDLMSAAE